MNFDFLTSNICIETCIRSSMAFCGYPEISYFLKRFIYNMRQSVKEVACIQTNLLVDIKNRVIFLSVRDPTLLWSICAASITCLRAFSIYFDADRYIILSTSELKSFFSSICRIGISLIMNIQLSFPKKFVEV